MNSAHTATVFAALGDETRLAMISRLKDGRPLSISRLTASTPLTRQAVTKHLRVLEEAGLVRSRKSGRESVFELRPKALDQAQAYLEQVSRHWDAALERLRALVED